MKSYLQYVSAYRTLLEQGKKLPSVQARPVSPAGTKDGPVILLFSPHPDDECTTGGLALRLQREAGARVVNIPVTFGSNIERRAARREELKNACAHLGFELADSGLEGFQTPQEIAQILKTYRPRMIFFPHAEDWNGTHERVHRLIMDALPLADVDCLLVQTEFWRPMKQPNLMVELSAEDLAALVEALSLHTGEVARNPYHLMLPEWMMDNVRRGGEVVGGQGGAIPDFTFATLYHLSKWVGGAQQDVLKNGRALPSGERAGELLKYA
jgi:LmbE family N-acetylglucosaminyl deacetylase